MQKTVWLWASCFTSLCIPFPYLWWDISAHLMDGWSRARIFSHSPSPRNRKRPHNVHVSLPSCSLFEGHQIQGDSDTELMGAGEISNALKTVTRNLQADFTIVSRGCLAPMWQNDSRASRWNRDDSRASRWSRDNSVLSDARAQTLHIRNTWRANPGPRGPTPWV